MNVLSLQTSLAAAGEDPGPLDGVPGVRTWSALLRHIAHGQDADRALGIAQGLAANLAAYGIDTRLRVIHFLAQAAHESDRFRNLQEIGGPRYFARYDGRADLGNTRPGDGARYHGRGIFMLTGRANYRRYGAKIGADLEGVPELAAAPHTAAKLACMFWHDHKLNAAADRDDIRGVTLPINGGYNGLDSRKGLLAELKRLWPS